MVPNYALIGEIRLFSFGFERPRELAEKYMGDDAKVVAGGLWNHVEKPLKSYVPLPLDGSHVLFGLVQIPSLDLTHQGR